MNDRTSKDINKEKEIIEEATEKRTKRKKKIWFGKGTKNKR